jgi:hypothetical protein
MGMGGIDSSAFFLYTDSSHMRQKGSNVGGLPMSPIIYVFPIAPPPMRQKAHKP